MFSSLFFPACVIARFVFFSNSIALSFIGNILFNFSDKMSEIRSAVFKHHASINTVYHCLYGYSFGTNEDSAVEDLCQVPCNDRELDQPL